MANGTDDTLGLLRSIKAEASAQHSEQMKALVSIETQQKAQARAFNERLNSLELRLAAVEIKLGLEIDPKTNGQVGH